MRKNIAERKTYARSSIAHATPVSCKHLTLVCMTLYHAMLSTLQHIPATSNTSYTREQLTPQTSTDNHSIGAAAAVLAEAAVTLLTHAPW
jgi:hypothetical protein